MCVRDITRNQHAIVLHPSSSSSSLVAPLTKRRNRNSTIIRKVLRNQHRVFRYLIYFITLVFDNVLKSFYRLSGASKRSIFIVCTIFVLVLLSLLFFNISDLQGYLNIGFGSRSIDNSNWYSWRESFWMVRSIEPSHWFNKRFIAILERIIQTFQRSGP